MDYLVRLEVQVHYPHRLVLRSLRDIEYEQSIVSFTDHKYMFAFVATSENELNVLNSTGFIQRE